MSFRPARRVVDPDGREWELYVSRSDLPSWKPADYGDMPAIATSSRMWFLLALVEIPLFFIFQVLVPLLRLIAELPVALVRVRRSQERLVDAITFWPHEESYRWTTTSDHLERVLDQVAVGLEGGQIARPLDAEFRGAR